MKWQSPRRWLVVSLLAFTAMGVSACGKKSTGPKPPGPPTITQTDADDIAQFVAASISSDNGGWYATVKAMAESLSTVTTNAPGATDTNTFVLSATTTDGAPANLYTFHIAYYNANQVGYPVRDTASVELEADVHMAGNLFTADNIGSTYGYDSEWSFIVSGLRAVNDTVEFSTIADDTAFAQVNSVFTTETDYRYWYHLNSSYATLVIPKNRLHTDPYPVGGNIEWIIETYPMKKPSRDTDNDAFYDILAEAEMTFDGTPVARFRIVDTLSDSAYEYRYSINLNTGEVARLP